MNGEIPSHQTVSPLLGEVRRYHVLAYFFNLHLTLLASVWVTSWSPGDGPFSFLVVFCPLGPASISLAVLLLFINQFVVMYHHEMAKIFTWSQTVKGLLAESLLLSGYCVKICRCVFRFSADSYLFRWASWVNCWFYFLQFLPV